MTTQATSAVLATMTATPATITAAVATMKATPAPMMVSPATSVAPAATMPAIHRCCGGYDSGDASYTNYSYSCSNTHDDFASNNVSLTGYSDTSSRRVPATATQLLTASSAATTATPAKATPATMLPTRVTMNATTAIMTATTATMTAQLP